MSKVISALDGGQNALLEAPTGSGKTLSLLCSSIAWQEREKQRIEEGEAKLYAEMAAHAAEMAAAGVPLDGIPGSPMPAPTDPTSTAQSHGSAETRTPATGTATVQHPSTSATPGEAPSTTGTGGVGGGGFLPDEHNPDAHPEFPSGARPKPPKIFYATRTHSQIAQVVRELKRSGYSPRMAVLASKQHYCVNAHARAQPSLDEACGDLLADNNCVYFRNVQPMLMSGIVTAVHDIEDLCKAGKRQRGCPYYVSRKLVEDADVIFGPYNYLVDPVIRRSMGLESPMEGAIVIFDEAHNIEDVSREAASMDIERLSVMESHGAFSRAAQFNKRPEVYEPLKAMMGTILQWMDAKEKEAVAAIASRPGGQQRRNGYASRWKDEVPYERMWHAQQMLNELNALGLGHEGIDPLWTAYQEARQLDEDSGRVKVEGAKEPEKPESASNPAGSSVKSVRVGSAALGMASRIIQVVRMLYECSDDGARDFKLVMKRVHHSVGGGSNGGGGARAFMIATSNSLDTTNGASPAPLPDHLLTLSLWCLNPAVAFRTVARPAHSIILTSGTLSPLDSFASELGSPFPIRLEAPHVVNMARQVWAGVVGAGPGGEQLLATYQHTNTTDFQDAVGNTIVHGCRTIPDGVLLFLPSYAMLDKLVGRWKVTGVWSRLAQLKTIVQEPRSGGKEALQATMTEYYDSIASGRGGLFMAVCRGKVSEGLDFADANARGVMVVGIPFPNVKDTKVEAKRKYNDAGARSMGLLTGSVWYEQQAFRALNQAVGRCIRHRGDWGAIVLIDERFNQSRYQTGLSRWVRGALAPHASFHAASASMEAFFARLAADPPAAPKKLVPDLPEAPLNDPPVNAIALMMAGHKAVGGASKKMPAELSKGPAEVVVQPAQQLSYEQTLPPPPSAAIMHYHQQQQQQHLKTSAHTIVCLAPLDRCVRDELSYYVAFVLNLGSASHNLDAQNLAVEGIFDTFSRALETLKSPTPYHSWISEFSAGKIPWGVQAVLALVPHQLPVGTALDVEAATFAGVNLSHLHPVEVLEAMVQAYKEVLVRMGVSLPAAVSPAGPVQQWGPAQQVYKQEKHDTGGVKRKWDTTDYAAVEGRGQQGNAALQQPPCGNNSGNGAAAAARQVVLERAMNGSANDYTDSDSGF